MLYFIEFFCFTTLYIINDLISISTSNDVMFGRYAYQQVVFCTYLFCLFYFIICFIFCFIFFVIRCLFVIIYDFLYQNFDIAVSYVMCDIIYLDFMCLLLVFFGYLYNITQGFFCFIFICGIIFIILYYVISIFFSNFFMSTGRYLNIMYILY
ncbi:unnamed protein product [Phytomonas sp. Hart1]|nr:unnamed protein product [Phytomonas sp. Hart1]|eukprot:CCW72302.1 unnamed protein product [Phytomonas sp. isolate Hart1]